MTGSTESTGRDSEAADRPETTLERLRTEQPIHTVALVGAILAGVGLAWLHWIGLLVAGGLVGVVSPSLRRAVVGGLAVGLVVLAVFAIDLGSAAGPVLEMSQIVWLTVASALVLPVFGSLLRGVV